VGGFYARFASKDALFDYFNSNVQEEIVANARELFSEVSTHDLTAQQLIARYI
jgi:AcrR family transcriptional regulator